MNFFSMLRVFEEPGLWILWMLLFFRFFFTQKWFKSLQIIHFPVNMLLIFKKSSGNFVCSKQYFTEEVWYFCIFLVFFILIQTHLNKSCHIAYLCIFVSVWYICYSVLIRTVKISCVIISNFSLMLLGLFHSNELIAVVLLLKNPQMLTEWVAYLIYNMDYK